MRNALLLIFGILVVALPIAADLGDPSCNVNIEIKSETGTVPPSAISYELWLNDGYSTKVTSSNWVIYEKHDLDENEEDDLGLLVITTRSVFNSFQAGDVLHVWVQDSSNSHESSTDVTLNYENTIILSGNDALKLVSSIQTKSANTSSAESYTFNSGARDNAVDCTVALQSPSGTSGNITIGILNSIPASIPVSAQAIDLGFYFDARSATIGSGNFQFTISWDDTDVALDGSSNYGLFISEDGTEWINTDNYANGTSSESWSDNSRATDQVTFNIDHLPHSIVLGDGTTATYTESTPDAPASLMFSEIGDDGFTLQWVASSFPDESYDIQKSSNPFTSWTNISNPTISSDGNIKQYEVTESLSSAYFYRVKANNHSSQSSGYSTSGYKKNLLASGWNLVAYSLGEDGYNVQGFYDDISNIASENAVKIWNYDTQTWDIKTTSANDQIDKGDCFMVKTTTTVNWYNTGTPPAEDMQYSLNYKSGISGYNVVMRPWDESSATTVSGLHTTLFGSSITDGTRTISWFDTSSSGIRIYDGYKLTTSGSIALGAPLIIHMKTGDSQITWPPVSRKGGVK